MLYLKKMIGHILSSGGGDNTHELSPNRLSFEYHKKCGDADESPISNNASHLAHNGKATRSDGGYLCSDK